MAGTEARAGAALIGLDWGTTALRAWLLDAGGGVLATRAAPHGIMQLPEGGFPAAFAAIAGDWRADHPELPALAAGMVGSAQGWREAPYRECPAGPEDLAGALTRVPLAGGGALHVIPGVARFDALPDVMRGEETQVAGALALHPEMAASALLVLPGTHSKWVRVEDGRIRSFRTFMTGELFSVLRGHSILGRPAQGAAAAAPEEAARAFDRGVAAVREGGEGLAPLLFSARALVLAERLGAAESLDYLSGLLIGEELRCGLAGGAPPRITLIGEDALCARYRRALALFGSAEPRWLEGATIAGLLRVARAAGLLTR